MGVQYEARLSREGSQFSEHTNCLPLKNIPSTTEFTDCRGLGVRNITRVDKLTLSKHNHVSIFTSTVTSVYIISDRDLGTLVLFFSVYLTESNDASILV